MDLHICSINVRDKSGVEKLEHRSVDFCCVQETTFRGKSVRMISGKTADFKLFWIRIKMGLGRKRIFLDKK